MAYDPYARIRKPKERVHSLTALHPLVRVTLYVVLFWYTNDLVQTFIWRLAAP